MGVYSCCCHHILVPHTHCTCVTTRREDYIFDKIWETYSISKAGKDSSWDIRMADVCGIIADIKREGEGEYVIPTCTVFGLNDDELAQLGQHGLRIQDENTRHEGVEIRGSSPFKVMRILCKNYGWTTDGKAMQTEAPGDRTTSMWHLFKKI